MEKDDKKDDAETIRESVDNWSFLPLAMWWARVCLFGFPRVQLSAENLSVLSWMKRFAGDTCMFVRPISPSLIYTKSPGITRITRTPCMPRLLLRTRSLCCAQ